jgi:hypothetical protein
MSKILVKYSVVQAEKDMVVDQFERTFNNAEERAEFEKGRIDVYLSLRVRSVEEVPNVVPITPGKVIDEHAKGSFIPQEVVEAVNELLLENGGRGGRVQIMQEDIIERVQQKLPGLERQEIFKRKYLDFERLFQSYGWSVTHDGPAYNETYKPYFMFVPVK